MLTEKEANEILEKIKSNEASLEEIKRVRAEEIAILGYPITPLPEETKCQTCLYRERNKGKEGNYE